MKYFHSLFKCANEGNVLFSFLGFLTNIIIKKGHFS